MGELVTYESFEQALDFEALRRLLRGEPMARRWSALPAKIIPLRSASVHISGVDVASTGTARTAAVGKTKGDAEAPPVLVSRVIKHRRYCR